MLGYRQVGSSAALIALVAVLFSPPRAVAMDVPMGQPVDGIKCESMEGAVFHVHQHLAVFDHGKPVPIPADLGQVVSQCLYWVHTHTADGVVHIESPTFRTFTLGNLFDIWAEPLGPTAVGPAHIHKGQLIAYVNGLRFHGDPRKIELAQRTDITLEAGPPYAKPALFKNWGSN